MYEPPNNLDAERAVLGSIFLNREAITAVASWLRPDDFYLVSHQEIYAAMLSCFNRRIPPDTRLVTTALKDAGKLEQVGGILYLAELTDGVPTSYHIEHYGRLVEQSAIRRSLIDASGKVAAIAFDTTRLIADVLTEVQSTIATATRRASIRRPTALTEVYDAIYARMSAGITPGICTGYSDLDRMLGGLRPGKLYVLGGRPGNGKSALALNVASRIAKQGRPVLYISLEMEKEELGERMLAITSRVNSQSIGTYQLSETDAQAVLKAMGDTASLPLWIEDAGGLSLAEVRARANSFMSEHGELGLLVVDYLTLLNIPTARGENRATAVGMVANGLKTLAKELSCPILLLAQLNREIDRRAGGVPIPELSDLRESGDIEAAADVVAFAVRPELYDEETDRKGILDVWVRKQRGGPLGRVPFRFVPETTSVDSLVLYTGMEGY